MSKIPFGICQGNLVHISEVTSGLSCNCFCPGCGSPLIARKGKSAVHHFAHHKKDCENAYETAIHLAAKNILKKHKRLTLPTVSFEVGHHKDSWLISEEKHIIFDTVELETKIEDIIPDALMKIGKDILLVEITVTHKTSEEKIRKAKKYGLSILDIDLSGYDRAFNLEDLVEEIIHKTTRKKWLSNIKLEKIKSELFRIHEEKKEDKYGFVKCEIMGSKKANVMNDCKKCHFYFGIKEGYYGLWDRKGHPYGMGIINHVMCLQNNNITRRGKYSHFQ